MKLPWEASVQRAETIKEAHELCGTKPVKKILGQIDLSKATFYRYLNLSNYGC